jgi:mycothiol synthase
MEQLAMRRADLEALPQTPLQDGYLLDTRQVGDEADLAALLRISFAKDEWTPEHVAQVLSRGEGVVETFVVRCAGQIVATASVRLVGPEWGGAGMVHWVAAHPAHGGRGLGRVVTEATLREMRRRGLPSAVLTTDDHRLAAVATYRALGFAPDHGSGRAGPERWAAVLSALDRP